MSFEARKLRRIIEGALLAAGHPLTRERLISLFADDEERPDREEVQAALEDIQADCKERGYELVEVASGWRFQVRAETAHWVNRLWEEKPQKYSRALLETLALIAYRQPITRGDIEEIRGVAVSSHIIKTLTEREWVKVVGHRDVPGRPSLFATTRHFLDYFNLKSLDELPTLGEIKDIDRLNNELELTIDEAINEIMSDSHSEAEAETEAETDFEPESRRDEEVAESPSQPDADGAANTGADATTGSDDSAADELQRETPVVPQSH